MSAPSSGAAAVASAAPQVPSALHAAHCWHAIVSALGGAAGVHDAYDMGSLTGSLLPFFVTLKSRRREGDAYDILRGCKGTLSERPVAEIVSMARTTAFHDTRFKPVVASELENLQLSISLLVQYERAASPTDWAIGKHGILIKFSAAGGSFSATYLPEVAGEQGWTREEAVQSLVRKAGFSGRIEDVWAAIECTRYQSAKCFMTFTEWRDTHAASYPRRD